MKKTFVLIVIAVLLLLPLSLSARQAYFTPAAQLACGLGDKYNGEIITYNPGIGAGAILGFSLSEEFFD